MEEGLARIWVEKVVVKGSVLLLFTATG
jgi:hypothetical protein